ncbi:MAG: hypothetical protein KBG21_10600 [Ignavibacteria bacterium]|nr:hypothetical protein [Ignavibacteria bacterium]
MRKNPSDQQFSYTEFLYKKKPFRLMTPKERIDWLWAQMKYKYDSGRAIIRGNAEKRIVNSKKD